MKKPVIKKKAASRQDPHLESPALRAKLSPTKKPLRELRKSSRAIAAERLLDKKTHDLGERVKELNCLYSFSTILEKPKITPPEIFQGLVDILPPAYQYPEVTCARLILGDSIYICTGFRETAWKQSAPVLARGERLGTIEVYYLEERPAADEGPFLIEERRLLDALAERLGKAVERLSAEAALERTNAELERLLAERTKELRISDDNLQREIKQADALEDDLLLERAKFKVILDHMNTGVVIISPNYEIEYINPVIEHEFGPVRGRPCHRYFNLLDSPCPWCRNREVFGGRSIKREWESPANGRTYDLFDTPIPNPEGTVSKLAIFHDITGLKQSEKSLRESEARLREISSRLLTIQEEERKRFARELHDGLGQMLSSIKFILEGMASSASSESYATGFRKDILRLVRESIDEVRRMQMDLRPPMLDDLGILATLAWFTREFFGIYSRIRCEKRFDVREDEVPGPLKIVLFRITQEALNNAAKHSRSDLVVLSLTRTHEGLVLEITDNGVGFDPSSSKTGFGLTGMRERAHLSGGRLAVESGPGKGTRVLARWPL